MYVEPVQVLNTTYSRPSLIRTVPYLQVKICVRIGEFVRISESL